MAFPVAKDRGCDAWLISYRKPRGGKVNQATKAAFGDFLDKSAAIEIEPMFSQQPTHRPVDVSTTPLKSSSN